MHKLSYLDLTLDKTNREAFLISLEEKILGIPALSELSKKVLAIEIPFEQHDHKIPKDLRTVSKSLLYHMLDKGIIFRGGSVTAWSNSASFRTEFYESEGETESEVQKYFLERKINQEDLEQVMHDVNQYLEGFDLHFNDIGHSWLFGFSCHQFNKNMEEQLKHDLAKSS